MGTPDRSPQAAAHGRAGPADAAGAADDVMAPTYSKLIVDLDGTLYRGSRALPGAVETLARLRDTCEILFLSNNCNQSADHLAQRLRRLSFEAHPHEIVSTVTLMVQAVNELGTSVRVASLSSGDLNAELERAGHRVVKLSQHAEVVIVGVDVDVNYAGLARVLDFLLSGAVLIGANVDPTYPSETGPLPGAGAFVGAVQGMGFSPARMCGKPDPWAMRTAFELRGFTPDERCLLVGDRLDSDVLGAQALGIDSALVLTGASTQADIEQLNIRPTYVVESLRALPTQNETR